MEWHYGLEDGWIEFVCGYKPPLLIHRYYRNLFESILLALSCFGYWLRIYLIRTNLLRSALHLLLIVLPFIHLVIHPTYLIFHR